VSRRRTWKAWTLSLSVGATLEARSSSKKRQVRATSTDLSCSNVNLTKVRKGVLEDACKRNARCSKKVGEKSRKKM